jgi:hypothetical protein
MVDINNPYTMSYVNFSLVLLISTCLLFYRFIFPKKKINIFVLLLLIGLVPTLSIFRDGTYRSGDLTTHAIQLIDFYRNLSEGALIPRWAGDLCGSYGCPVFVIEYILPYYIGSLFHFIGFSFLTSMKLVLVSSFVASGITMYLWVKEECGKIPGFISAVFYLYAPYHLIDLHFRGSAGEVVSFIFIPLLFLFIKKLIESGKLRYFFLEAITVSLLIVAHSSTTVISLPLAVGYGMVVWIRKKKKQWRDLVLAAISIGYGISLAAFYWLPGINGVKYTWWIFTTFGDFKPITEYLYSPILYGLLFQGHQGEYRLIIGYFHLLAIIFAIVLILKNKIEKKLRLLLLFLLLSFGLLFFMLQSISTPIWKHISILHTFIMVWRLLVPIAFITAAIAAVIAKKITNIKVAVILCFFLISSTIPNWANRKMVPLSTTPFLRESEIYTEYFEKGNPIFEQSLKKNQPNIHDIVAHPPKQPVIFLKGNGEFAQLKRTQIEHEYVLYAQQDVLIRENTHYFPGWKVFINNKEVAINYKYPNSIGKIVFPLKKGVYKIVVQYTDSPIVQLAQAISMSAVLLGIAYLSLFSILLKRRVSKFNL